MLSNHSQRHAFVNAIQTQNGAETYNGAVELLVPVIIEAVLSTDLSRLEQFSSTEPVLFFDTSLIR